MTKVRKDTMQTNTDTVAKPKLRPPAGPRAIRLLQAEVDKELFDLAAEEMKRANTNIKKVAEYGLKAFLLKVNPDKAKKFLDREAARLGLKIED